jgi:CRP-like cAMP-binding protein
VPVPLTHRLLSELVAARRPSVTSALSRLQERGTIQRDGSGWLVRAPDAALRGDLAGEDEDVALRL